MGSPAHSFKIICVRNNVPKEIQNKRHQFLKTDDYLSPFQGLHYVPVEKRQKSLRVAAPFFCNSNALSWTADNLQEKSRDRGTQ